MADQKAIEAAIALRGEDPRTWVGRWQRNRYTLHAIVDYIPDGAPVRARLLGGGQPALCGKVVRSGRGWHTPSQPTVRAVLSGAIPDSHWHVCATCKNADPGRWLGGL